MVGLRITEIAIKRQEQTPICTHARNLLRYGCTSLGHRLLFEVALSPVRRHALDHRRHVAPRPGQRESGFQARSSIGVHSAAYHPRVRDVTAKYWRANAVFASPHLPGHQILAPPPLWEL